MNALEIVREVQKRLRMPQSSDFSDPHAQLILSFVNTVQRDLMAEYGVWDALKVYGEFDTEAGESLYTVAVEGKEIDVILNMSINGKDLQKVSDEVFRQLKKQYNTLGQPVVYRFYSRTAQSIIVELFPTPNAIYKVEVEALSKPPRLTQETDIPMLDVDAIIAGTLMLAKKEQGDDPSQEMALFQLKMDMHTDTYIATNFGDLEPV